MRTDRLLSITLYLINHKKGTARELADHFEVSLRTIQRDIDTLTLAGIPVYADRGKEGGYRILDTYTVNRQYFSPRELTALTSLVNRLNALLNDTGLKQTEEKLRNLAQPKTVKKKHQTLIMDFTPWGMDEERRRLFQEIYRCVEDKRVIFIRYASPEGTITEREIEPLSVIIKGSAWYVHGFCRLRQAMRLFKITRIIHAEPRDSFFNPENHPPYQEEFIHRHDTRPPTLFVLRFAPSARGRITDYYNPNSLHFMPDGSIIGFFPFPEDEWVYSWIMSFGPLVEILEPRHARDRIREWVRGMAGIYEKETGATQGRDTAL